MKKIKAFTMIEILIISILITVGLFTVRNAIDHARKTNENIKQGVIANQLATEGAELVYQMRNTNFLEYYYNNGLTDKSPNILNSCRLAYNFTECYNYIKGQNRCDRNPLARCDSPDKIIMRELYYYISGGKIQPCGCNHEPNCQDIKNDVYAICLKSGVRAPCPEGHDAGGDESTFGKFWRMIDGIGTYDMSATNNTGGKIITSSFCSEGVNAQEYRFCSRVAREGGGGNGGEVEICSTMTNFAEIEGEIVR